MKNPCVIPSNFKIPKRFSHEFLLFHGKTKVGRIAGLPGRKKIVFEMFDTPVSATKEEHTRFNSVSMDWMQESIEHLRYLCGGDK